MAKIHALQVIPESAYVLHKSVQIKVTSKSAVAYDKIDQQTNALISMIGENQVNYRFFIGFKVASQRQIFYESLTVEAKYLSDFVYDGEP